MLQRFVLDAARDAGLPPLAWCARMHRGRAGVEARAGRDVIIAPDALVEGAWDGPYGALGFDRAASLAGTGLRVGECVVRFVSGSGRQDRLYAARRGDDLWVSNSLVYALVAAGDAPDERFRRHVRELARQVRTSRFERTPQRHRGRHGPVDIVELRDVEIDRHLTMRPIDKVALPTPRDYDEVVALVDGVIARTFDNARDRARARRYEPLATLSRGYDSTATSALAARHGCREALTFAELAPGVASPDDGTEVAVHLGLTPLRRARDAWRSRADLPEAELWACPPPKMIPLASIERDLVDRVMVSGRYGDRLFPPPFLPEPRVAPETILCASSVCELRLRVGFIHFAPLFAFRPHVARLQELSRSDALAPWRLGGDYDRPIPRRIAEEAGVPRELFGMDKRAGAVDDVRVAADLCPPSRRDFDAFVADSPGLRSDLELRVHRAVDRALSAAHRRATSLSRRLRLPPPRRIPFSPTVHDERLFQWGFARTRGRYDGRAP